MKDAFPKIIGSVSNNYSNLLDVLVAEAKEAHEWNYDENETFFNQYQEDYSQAEVKMGDSKGYLFNLEDCGICDVIQIAEDQLVIPQRYSDDWNDELEVNFFNHLLNTPTSKNIRKIGTINVTSGLLSLSCPFDRVDKYDEKTIQSMLKKARPEKTESGLIVPLPKGDYEIWQESVEMEGDWGASYIRVRIVPEGTRVKAGEPLKKINLKPPKPKGSKAKGVAFLGPQKMQKVKTLSFSEDGAYLAAGELGGSHAVVWDTEGKIVFQKELGGFKGIFGFLGQEISDYDKKVFAAFHPKNPWLYIYCGKHFYQYEMPSGKLLKKTSPKKHLKKGYINGISVMPDGEQVVLSGHELYFFQAENLNFLNKLDFGAGSAYHLAFSQNGQTMIVPGYDLKFYDLKTLQETDRISTKTEKDYPTSSDVAYSPNEALLAWTLSQTGRIQIYDVKKKEIIQTLQNPEQRNRDSSAIAWHPDGKRLVSTCENGTIRLWEVKTGQILQEFPRHNNTIPGTGHREVYSLAFSSDGSRLAVSAGLKKKEGHVMVYEIK